MSVMDKATPTVREVQVWLLGITFWTQSPLKVCGCYSFTLLFNGHLHYIGV